MSTTTIPLKSVSNKSSQNWYKQMWVHVLVAMIIGIVVGYYFPAAGQKMQPLGDAFIKLIHMLIAPIIFCTVILGIAKMDSVSRVGSVAIKAIVYFEVITTLALIVALVMVNLWHPGVGMNVQLSALDIGSVKGYVNLAHQSGIVPFLMDIIPTDVVGSLAAGNILQVLFVSVVFGCALVALREYGKPLINILEVIAKVLYRTVGIVMWVAPIGAFGAIAFTVGKYGVGTLLSLGRLLLCFYVICLVFVFLVFGTLSKLAGFSLLKLMRYLREEILICFATTSSEVVLPPLITKMENLGCKSNVVGLVVPTGYSFNLDGTCLYLATVTVFLAQATNTPLDIYHQIGLLLVLLLTSKGAAGISGAAFVVLAATLSTVGTIPVASVALVLGVHRLLAEGMVPTNMIGNAVATIIISKWEGALDTSKLHRVLNGQTEKA